MEVVQLSIIQEGWSTTQKSRKDISTQSLWENPVARYEDGHFLLERFVTEGFLILSITEPRQCQFQRKLMNAFWKNSTMMEKSMMILVPLTWIFRTAINVLSGWTPTTVFFIQMEELQNSEDIKFPGDAIKTIVSDVWSIQYTIFSFIFYWIFQIHEQLFTNTAYDQEMVSQWTNIINTYVIKRLAELQLPFKFICLPFHLRFVILDWFFAFYPVFPISNNTNHGGRTRTSFSCGNCSMESRKWWFDIVLYL